MALGSWSPFKDLQNVAQEFALRNTSSSLHRLKALLRQHKPEFLSLLKNAAKNSEQRSKVKNAKTVGLPVEGDASPMLLEESLIEEALIISNLYDLNEFASVDLLIAAEQQVPNYPNYPRGLVAVLLYWDGRRNLVSALRTLMQCREGRTWTMGLSDESVAMATRFTDELLQNGLTKQILKLLCNIQVEAEMEKLGKQRGLGDAKHRKQIRDLITEVRQCLADCLFYFAGQSGLPRNDVLDIIGHLQKQVDLEADGKLSSTHLAVVFSLFYSFSLPYDAQTENDEAAIKELMRHPVLSDNNFLGAVHKALTQDTRGQVAWKVPGIKASLKFAWSLLLRSVAQIPTSLFAGESVTQPNADVLEQDENVLEESLAERAFLFIKESMVRCDGFHSEESFLRRLHGLITDLIVNMPLKVKDMRNHGDEVARITMLHLMEGEESPPELRKDFEQLMQLITCMYDQDPLNLQLSVDFWCLNDTGMMSDGGTFIVTPQRAQRTSHKQMTLFKFIRQSGDLLPPLLYIPYLRMLAALSTGSKSARGAFEMLRVNGTNLGNGGGEISSISWDHFFSSCQRYYTNLRQDKPIQDVSNPFATQNPFAVQTHGTPARNITPQEVDGLKAVMQLTAKITQYDDIACIAMYEHSQWSACGVLFGLLQCPIPVDLKGDVINVIAQFARIPDISMGLLQMLESSQLLHTLPDTWTSTTGNPIGLPDELEEIEAREEEFPMTRCFLKLLGRLVESGASLAVLGEGTRSPGFDPYLNFTIESVFLKFQSRAYGREEEKWEVASCALKLFNDLLAQYQPLPEHFNADRAIFSADSVTHHSSFLHDSTIRSTVSSPRAGKPPGFSLLLYIYNEGNFFKTIMNIIGECIAYLDKYLPKLHLESTLVETTVLAMELLHNALQLQESFLAGMRESGKPLLITTLDKLLLGVNAKSGKADYLVNIAKFVVHNSSHTHLSLLASTILSWLCFSSVPTQREVVMVMMNSCSVVTQQKIVHGFVEVLDTPCPEGGNDNEEADSSSYLSQTKLAILRLLIRCVDLPSPNFTQFLLGFDMNKPTNTASLQDPGILGTPRSCLHSVLTILTLGTDQCAAGSYQPDAVTETPQLAELCYQLLYRLSANMDTTGPVMRYLRSSYDLVYKHLEYLPFQDAEGVGVSRTNYSLMQQAWLLKMAAIELYSLSSKQQRTNVQRILQLLFKQGGRTANQPSLGSTTLFGQSTHQASLSLRSTIADQSTMLDASGSFMPSGGENGTMKIIKIFELLNFSLDFPAPLALDQFVESVVEQAVQSCETTNEHGVVYCDIKALHDVLRISLITLTSSDDVNRRQMASHEVQKVLHTVVERNRTRETVHARLSFLSAWRHALEIALATSPDESFPRATRQQILLDVLQHLVNRVRQADAALDITSPVAAIVLALMMHVRSCFMGQDTVPETSISNKSHLVQLLNTEENAVVDLTNIAPLQVVIRGIVEWLLLSGLTEKVRTDLYASLLYYLQLCKRPSSSSYKASSGVLSSLEDVHSRLNRVNFKLFKSYGDSLVDLVCKDACNGQSVCRVLALACLDSIVQIDVQQTWLQYMIRNGYLGHISHSILVEDEHLQEYLNPAAEPLRSVYIYEQKMALLSSIAETPAGARAAIDSGALAQLSECVFLEMRPSSDKLEVNAFVPGLVNRFRQLLFPALRFCSALLATLGGQQHCEVSALILQFLLAHADSIVNSVLRVRRVPTDVQTLTELKLVTGVLSQTAGQDFTDPSLFGSVPQEILMEIQGHLLRIQRQLLSILPHFFLSRQALDDLKQTVNEEEGSKTNFEEITALLHEVGCNILVYCRSVVLRSSPDSSVFLFAPDMSESTFDSTPYGPEHLRRQPALGVVFRILRNVVSRYTSQCEEKKREEWKLENVSNFNAQDLNEVIGDNVDQLSLLQEQKLAGLVLSKSIKRKEEHLCCLYHVMENGLLLLWQHLDYFILKVAPIETMNSNILFPHRDRRDSSNRTPLRRLQDISGINDSFTADTDGMMTTTLGKQAGVRKADIERLKHELPSSIPGHFLQKLCQIEVQTKGAAGYFIQPLVRRLQHIIKLHSTPQ